MVMYKAKLSIFQLAFRYTVISQCSRRTDVFQDPHKYQNLGMLKSLTENGVVFASNLYLHISCSRVCLHLTPFMWISVVLGVSVKFKFCFLELFWDFFLLPNFFFNPWLVESSEAKPDGMEGWGISFQLMYSHVYHTLINVKL